MSRLRSTLESVSKAVSGTQAEILSRIAQLRAVRVEKEVTANEEERVTEKEPTAPAIPADSVVPPAASAHLQPPSPPPPAATVLASVVKDAKEKRQRMPGDSPSQARREIKTPQSKTSTSPTLVVSKPATPLFHPGSFTVNLDETYNYVANHINTYFSSNKKGAPEAEEKKHRLEDDGDSTTERQQDQNRDQAPPLSTSTSLTTTVPQASPPPTSPPPSPKKGLSHYLSYGAPVQAFVGSYIAPLVPKFRSEAKPVIIEKSAVTPEDAVQEKIVVENKEKKAAEEKAKRLLLQRERVRHAGQNTDHEIYVLNNEHWQGYVTCLCTGL